MPDIGLLRPPLAARPALTLRQEPVPDTAKLTNIGAALVGLAKTAEASDAISGQGRLDVLRYGHVLQARRLVSVRGAGLAYDGLYYVKSVTHDIKRGEYKQSFTLGARRPRLPDPGGDRMKATAPGSSTASTAAPWSTTSTRCSSAGSR